MKRKKQRVLLENVLITDIAAEGKSIATVDGKVLFVPFAIPGDVVDVQLTTHKKNYIEGFVVQMHTPSPNRIEPFCTHFGCCGGCRWQPLPYSLQLQFKQQQVYEQLTRIGHLTLPSINPIIPSEKTMAYRNKLEFTFSNRSFFSRKELENIPLDERTPQNALGFHVGGFFDKVLDINHCYLQPEPSNQIRNAVNAFAQTHQYPFFDLKTQSGFLRTLIIRTSSIGEVMAIVAFAYEDRERRETLLNHIEKSFPEISSVMYVINEKRNDSFDGLEVLPYFGHPFIMEQMESLQFKVGPKSFYQTNSEQAHKLYSVVRDFAALSGDELLYDLYTGTGTIALFLSRYAKKVIGIEYVEEAVEDALENSKINGISNTHFYAGDMRKILNKEFLDLHGIPDVMVLDPPRSGVHPAVINTILDATPLRIIYVSCNPATQARDLHLLSSQYQIIEVQPIDMFPHTHHIENIVLLKKGAV